MTGMSSASVTSTTAVCDGSRNIVHARSASRRRIPGGTTSTITFGTRSMSSPCPVAGASTRTTSKGGVPSAAGSIAWNHALPSIAHSYSPGTARKKVRTYRLSNTVL